VRRTIYVKVPRRPGRRIRILLRDPAWVAKGVPCGKGYEAAAWFQASRAGTSTIGTIALSKIDLNLVVHECTHAAFELVAKGPVPGDEESICTLAGELSAKVWARLQEWS